MNRADIPPELPRAPRRRPWSWLLVAGLPLVPAVLALGLGWQARYKADQEIREAIAETDRTDSGWRFEELEQQRRPIPDEQNGALRVLAARRLLPGVWRPWPTGGEPVIEEELDHLPPQQQLNREQLGWVRALLQKTAPGLKEARRLAELPDGRYPIAWPVDYLSARNENVQESRIVADLLRFDILRLAQEGDADGACRSELALMNAGRSVGDEYTLVLMLVRTSLSVFAVGNLERVLAQGEPNEASLAAVQRLLEREDEETPAATVTALRGERALTHRVLEAAESGRISFPPGLRPGPPSLGERIDDTLSGVTVRRLHAAYLHGMTAGIEVVKAPGPKLSARFTQAASAALQGRVKPGDLLGLVVRPLEAVTRKQALVRSAFTAVALERYRRAHGSWPDSIDALVPSLLRQVPLDPYDGKPLRYRRLADGVVVYSVGADGEDNGGALDRSQPPKPGTGLGVRLWDVAHRRQAPTPRGSGSP